MHDDGISKAYQAPQTDALETAFERRPAPPAHQVMMWIAAGLAALQGLGGLYFFILRARYPHLVNIGQLSVLDASIVLLPMLLELCGGLFLWMKRKQAFGCFLAAVVIRALLYLRSPLPAIVPAPLAWAILVALCAYAFWARRKRWIV